MLDKEETIDALETNNEHLKNTLGEKIKYIGELESSNKELEVKLIKSQKKIEQLSNFYEFTQKEFDTYKKVTTETIERNREKIDD